MIKMVRITFRTTSVDFVRDGLAINTRKEIVRVLRKLADEFENNQVNGCIQDINGNTIGKMVIE